MLALLEATGIVAQAPRLDVRLVTDEAEAVLAIVEKHAAGSPIEEADWQDLFGKEGYRRLKQREASLGRAFEDSAFQSFVLSSELGQRRTALRAALAKWKSVDLATAARRAFSYLPERARVRVKVYPSIKPRPNTFVFETRTDPAIFYYLDPAVSPAKFENTLIHEFHHIGHASVCSDTSAAAGVDDQNVAAAISWIGGFAEGRAVLAAAGAADVHPHATSDSSERAIWDRDVARVAENLRRLEEFFLAVAAGGMTEAEQNSRGMGFINTDSVPQGPFYTVGYVMARAIESQLGRNRLVSSSCDARMFLADYNKAAAAINLTAGRKLPIWSPALLDRLAGR
jgi:hypothetical protein